MENESSSLRSPTKAEPYKIPLPPSIDEKKPEREPVKVGKPKEPRHHTVDDDNVFWQTYVSEASRFDGELLDNWTQTLDSLLLFAALFSAINTAFIIESYRHLQPDSAEVTNNLLRLLLKHRNDNVDFNLEDLGTRGWNPGSEAVRINSTLFASLACSLLASFGAILGKEMLVEYKSAGALSTLPEQGRKRQRKFNGLKLFRFKLLMQLLPALLQLSLALFLIGIIDFLWQVNFTVAVVILVPVVVGFALYFASLGIALRWPDSPFQTSISMSLRLLLSPLVASTQANIAALHALRERLSSEETPWLKLTMEPLLQRARGGRSKIKSHFFVARPPLPAVLKRAIDAIKASRLAEGFQKATIVIYIAGLGIGGWCVSTWNWMRQTIGLDDEGRIELQDVLKERDIISADCVVWLLEKAEDREVIHKALETVSLLPPEGLLTHFRERKKILERHVPMYNSSLYRRAGDYEFRLEEGKVNDAITAGTALFHVLKAREEGEDASLFGLSFGGDPEFFDWLEDPVLEAKIDFRLLTVFQCIQAQMGVESFDVSLLLRLLRRFLSVIQEDSDTTAALDEQTPMQGRRLAITTNLDMPPISMLLDSVIFCASQRYHEMPDESVVSMCSDDFDEILETIYSILETLPNSMTLTSHVALVLATIQWYMWRDSDQSGLNLRNLSFNNITVEMLRAAWLRDDKRANFFDNIGLAFGLVCSDDSPPILALYNLLLRRTEYFMPKVMDVSSKADDWSDWWWKVVGYVPGMLWLLEELEPTERTETSHIVIRILSRVIPDDWSVAFAVVDDDSPANLEEFQIISPIHDTHGADMISLISSILSAFDLASPQVRKATTEVLGWMMLYPGVDAALLDLTNDQDGMYGQEMSIPSFLISMMKNTEIGLSENMREYCEHHFKLLIQMEPPEGSFSHTVQEETLVIVLANSSEFIAPITPESNVIPHIYTLINRKKDTFPWPPSFADKGIVQRVSSDGVSGTILQLTDESEGNHSGNRQLLCGEALVMLWRKCSSQQGSDVPDSRYLFREDAILMIIECLDLAVERNCEISHVDMEEYLAKALDFGWIDDELKVRVDKARDDLKFAGDHGWDALVLRRVGDKPSTPGDSSTVLEGNTSPQDEISAVEGAEDEWETTDEEEPEWETTDEE